MGKKLRRSFFGVECRVTTPIIAAAAVIECMPLPTTPWRTLLLLLPTTTTEVRSGSTVNAQVTVAVRRLFVV